jgi:hypothetical protein
MVLKVGFSPRIGVCKERTLRRIQMGARGKTWLEQ